MAELNCGCPELSSLNRFGVCERTIIGTRTASKTMYTCAAVGFVENFGDYGAYIFEEITDKILPIVQSQVGATDSVTTTDFLTEVIDIEQIITGVPWSTRLVDTGVWPTISPNPINEWIGLSFCVEAEESKVIYMGFASTTHLRISLNGQMIYLSEHTTTPGYKRWQIIPIEIPVGLNTFYFEAKSLVSISEPVFGVEIYDCTLSELSAATSSNLSSYVIASTVDKIGDSFELGENSGYSCAEGFVLETCNGTPTCIKRVYVDKEPCCMILTNCQNPLEQIFTNVDLTEYIGQFVNVELYEGCWEVSTSDLPCQSIQEVVVTESFESCEECVPTDQICYNLENCKDSDENMKVLGNLSGYVGNIVKVDGFDECWIVSESEEPCIPSIRVTVVDYFVDCDSCVGDCNCCEPKNCCDE